jgi:hypothetical protein
MAPDIPTQFSFDELLSHTFPGFFTAITLFMLIAIFSPRDITSWATKDISSFAQVVGFVIIFGTILGIIIDGIHHSIIEDNIFEKITGLKVINESLNALYPGSEELKLGYGYFFKLMTTDKSDPITTFKSLQSSMYRYSEFYANTFISLIPFSLIAPLYLSYVLQIPWIYSLIIGSMSLFIACACLNSSYVALKEYQKTKLSVLCGYLGYDYYIDLRACQRDFNYTEKIELRAKIFDRINKQVEKEGIEVIFNTTFGHIESIAKTNKDGMAKATLCALCCDFIWDDIQGNNAEDERLKEFLTQNYNIDWVRRAPITKTKDNTTISANTAYTKHNISLSLNINKTRVNLKIGDGRTDELMVMMDEKGRRRIYLCGCDKIVYDECGLAIVTATSKGPNDTANPNGCVPGVTWVHIRRG